MTTALVPDWDTADRMRKALRVADLNHSEMAEHLGVSLQTVSNWVGGRRQPNVATLRVWALRCGVPFEWLRDGDLGLVRREGIEPPTRWLSANCSARRETVVWLCDRRPRLVLEAVAA